MCCFIIILALSMRSTPEDEPPDPQQLRLDRMLESEVSFIILVYYFCITVKCQVRFPFPVIYIAKKVKCH